MVGLQNIDYIIGGIWKSKKSSWHFGGQYFCNGLFIYAICPHNVFFWYTKFVSFFIFK